MPWSHRHGLPVRILITLAAGFLAGVVGTIAHRMGAASNIPYGLALAFAIIIISTWCARARCNVIGVGFHLIASSAAVWVMAGYGPGGDVMIPVGFSGDLPFLAQHAGLIWLYGEIIVQLVMLVLPSRWFRIPPRTVPEDETADAASDDPENDGDVDIVDTTVADADPDDADTAGDAGVADDDAGTAGEGR